MNSKVIKWFKRQASIRRHGSEKPEEKLPSSNSASEEKKKLSFPRLSFRKRNRRKGDKGAESEGSASFIKISKKFSLSVPKEMEANTKDPVTTVPNSHSVNLGCISLMSTPNKTNDYSGATELSSHSSFDYSKENTNESISISEGESERPILTDKELSEISKTFNCDNQQSFHNASNSIHTINKSSYLGLGHKINARRENAPIVKMDDICDITSDKEHPEEMQSSSTSDSFRVTRSKAVIETSENCDLLSSSSDKIYEDLCDRNLEGHLTQEKYEETDLLIKKEMSSNGNETEINNMNENKADVFEEIDRLVRDATSITEEEVIEVSDDHKNSFIETEVPLNHNEAAAEVPLNHNEAAAEVLLNHNEAAAEGDEKKNSSSSEVVEEINDFNDSTSENITMLSTDESSNSCLASAKTEVSISEANDRDPNVGEFESNSCNSNVDNDPGRSAIISVIHDNDPSRSEIISIIQACENNSNENQTKDLEINNDITELPKNENEVELRITEESDLTNIDTTISKQKVNFASELQHSSLWKKDSLPSVQIVLTQSSPVKHVEIVKTLTESTSKPSVNYYPKDLNPFGDDDYETVNKHPDSVNVANEKVTPIAGKRSYTKENDISQFRRETLNNFNNRTRHVRESPSSPVRNIVASHETREDKNAKGSYTKSLNPFGDSDDNDDEGVSSLNSTNPFDDDEDEGCGDSPSYRTVSEPPPRLPPKSVDLQSRKNSRGSLAPVPIPRRSKQSHHGSYTSLQNVSTIPIPAPRSITPFGSTKTLNFSTNPFDDDENGDSFGDFERRGVGRSSMQSLPVSASLEPLSRIGVRGSLPPSAKLKLGKKKRPAPLPPGFSQRKHLYPNLTEFRSLPRKRSSTSPASDGGNFDKNVSSSREISPHRMPPPRPPPPKINF